MGHEIERFLGRVRPVLTLQGSHERTEDQPRRAGRSRPRQRRPEPLHPASMIRERPFLFRERRDRQLEINRSESRRRVRPQIEHQARVGCKILGLIVQRVPQNQDHPLVVHQVLQTSLPQVVSDPCASKQFRTVSIGRQGLAASQPLVPLQHDFFLCPRRAENNGATTQSLDQARNRTEVFVRPEGRHHCFHRLIAQRADPNFQSLEGGRPVHRRVASLGVHDGHLQAVPPVEPLVPATSVVTDPVPVHLQVDSGFQAVHQIVTRVQINVAPLAAIRADRGGMLQVPRSGLVEKVLRNEGAHWADIHDIPGPIGLFQSLVEEGVDHRTVTALDHGE